MKQLLIVRHAEAEPNAASDIKRNLTDYGKTQALKLKNSLMLASFEPDFVYVSTSNRTIQTLEILDFKCPHQADLSFYTFNNIVDIINWLESVPDHLRCVVLVGHNPIVSNLASYFVKSIHNLSTSNAVSITFDTNSWQFVTACPIFNVTSFA